MANKKIMCVKLCCQIGLASSVSRLESPGSHFLENWAECAFCFFPFAGDLLCVCVCGFALGRDLLQLGPKIDGENLSLSTPCLRHWTNWTFINRANKQGWLSKHKHTYVRKTERERELERQRAQATKSFLLVIFFLVGFRVCSTLRQFKINWFPCLAGCAGP